MNIEFQGRFGGGAGFHRAKRPVEALFLAALIVLGGCGGKEEAAPTTAAPVAAPGVPAGASAEVASASTVTPASVPQLLASASAAFGADRLVAPAGDNAIEYYLAVLGAEADNVQATQGLVDLFPLGVSIAEKEIAARNVEEATRIVGLLDESSPGSYTVQKLKSRLAATQAQIQREEERRLAAEAAQAQQQQAAAAQSQAQNQPTAAETASTAATRPAATTTAPARDTRPATEPERPVVAAPAPARPVGETRDARVVRQVQPGYPQLAYRRRLAGWVEIRFTVNTDGRVSNAEVIRSDPPRMFDREATRAVEQWQFEPALRDGEPVQTTLSRRIEFKYPG
jgi:protein TonB